MLPLKSVKTPLKIAVVIPVHNEADFIGEVVRRLSTLDHRVNLAVIVVDDGSADGSGQLAQEQGVFVIGHSVKQGKGQALRTGFAYVLQKGFDGVITMDGDGQHAVEDVQAFLQEACRDHEQHRNRLINGNRMHRPRGMPWLRLMTNNAMSCLISRMCRQRITDTQCGFRYIPRAILEKLDLKCSDFEIETEILVQACRAGFTVASIPVQTIYQQEESKIHPWKDTVRFIRYVVREMKRR